MLRIASIAAALIAVATALAGGSIAVAAAKPFPEVIPLPIGFRPEGIEVGRGTTFYVGSVASGAIHRGNLRTGAVEPEPLVPAESGRSATGIELDRHKRLFVAGGATGNAYVYDARTGDLLETYDLADAPTFINDVVVTRDAAYFTDSQKAVIYRVPIGRGGALGTAETIPLGGEYAHVDGQFNLNGIDATRSGKTLVAVQSFTGRLYAIDPATGVASEISLGGESVVNGDGILLNGRTLYVVQNRQNEVAVIALASDLSSGEVLTRLTDPDFRVPTTIDDLGRRLYTVNARFGTPNPDALEYEVVQLRKPRVR
jgi:sugar lactone lactonase YvrE